MNAMKILKTRCGFHFAFVITAVVLFYCHQLSAENKALKADLERAFVGKAVVSKIVFGGKAKPSGQWATYPVNTLVYPDATRVTFRVEQGAMRATVEDREMKQQFDQGTSFHVTAVDLKDDRLELKLETDKGDHAKLKLMLGDGWQSKFDISSVEAQLAFIFLFDQQPEQRKVVTTTQSSGSATHGSQTAAPTATAQPSASASPETTPRVFLQSQSKGSNQNADRDQSMEMSKGFEEVCPSVRITITPQMAD